MAVVGAQFESFVGNVLDSDIFPAARFFLADFLDQRFVALWLTVANSSARITPSICDSLSTTRTVSIKPGTPWVSARSMRATCWGIGKPASQMVYSSVWPSVETKWAMSEFSKVFFSFVNLLQRLIVDESPVRFDFPRRNPISSKRFADNNRNVSIDLYEEFACVILIPDLVAD